MGERKGVNKYYPPDYDPSKGGLNKFLGTHALRERARKLHLGILIIRFEMPYNIWCEGCNNHIGTGVRYNAEKKKVGMYYSTPIYQFRMKCHLCDNHFEIKTDPANLDYEIVTGARRQERRWDPTENEQVVPEDKEVTRKMAVDAMYKLEHGVDDKAKCREVEPVLKQLEQFQASRWHDDYASNKALRAAMRVKRVESQAQAKKDASYNLPVTLLPTSEEDRKMAQLLQFTQSKSSEQLREERRAHIDAQSVFAKLKPKKISQKTKKAYARQSLHDIVNNSQKSFAIKSSISPQILGIVPKKVDSLELPDKGEELKDINSNSSVCEENTSNNSNTDDKDKIEKDQLQIPLVKSSGSDSSSPATVVSQTAGFSPMLVEANFSQPGTSSVTPCASNFLCNTNPQNIENQSCDKNKVRKGTGLVSYDLSASDSDDSFH